MRAANSGSKGASLLLSSQTLLLAARHLIVAGVCLLPIVFSGLTAAQSQPASAPSGPTDTAASLPLASMPSGQTDTTASPQTAPATDQKAPGSISGTIIDQSGALAVGAKVKLTYDHGVPQEVVSGDNGQFSFSNVPPGQFQLNFSAPGFASHDVSGELAPGQAYIVPEVMLSLATAVTEVNVTMTTEEMAEVQIKEQEKQRVLGFIPNFYVTYLPDPAPLVARQKFQLAWKSVIDPITFLGVGFLAGVQQAADEYGGYGQGAEGYAKRFGAAYGDVFVGTMLGSAILPSLFKQDPRYFYKGEGSTRSRLLRGLSNSVMCKGDNKKWQVNYSGIIGSFATGGISYLYYPPGDRGAGLLVQNSLIRLAESSVAGVFQEFVLRKLTPHAKQPAQQQQQP